MFEIMFNGDFKEKRAKKIPLPGKKFDEVKELLLVLYPSAKPINCKSACFLLPLAQEYQIDLVTKRCEEFLLQRQKNDGDAMKYLLLARQFDLKKLYKECIKIAKKIPVQKLRKIKEYRSISCEVTSEIAMGRAEFLEDEIRKVKKEFLDCLKSIFNSDHCVSWKLASSGFFDPLDTISVCDIEDLLNAIEKMLNSSSTPF